MHPDRASTRSQRYLAQRRTCRKARWRSKVGEKQDSVERTMSKLRSYPVEVLERIDSRPQRRTQLHAWGNFTSLPRAPATPGQWRCSSSSFLLLLVPRVGGGVFGHEGRERGRPISPDYASVVTSTILAFGLGILDVFTKVRPEKPNPSRCMNASVERKWRTIGSVSPTCNSQTF